jgi:putative ABC transport system substrate-binding protein
MAQQRQAQVLVLMQSFVFAKSLPELASLALKSRLPSISGSGDSQFARVGGLMNYGVAIGRSWQRAAWFVHRIVQGASPADLPVEQPTRFEFSINRRTADALGVVVPPHLLALADEVFR